MTRRLTIRRERLRTLTHRVAQAVQGGAAQQLEMASAAENHCEPLRETDVYDTVCICITDGDSCTCSMNCN